MKRSAAFEIKLQVLDRVKKETEPADRCECGPAHMASHNAVCRYCAEQFDSKNTEYIEKMPSR